MRPEADDYSFKNNGAPPHLKPHGESKALSHGLLIIILMGAKAFDDDNPHSSDPTD